MEHETAMPADTHSQRVLDLASQKGLLRASDLDTIEAPRVVLTRLTAAGLLDRVGRGLYRLPGHPVSEHESLVMVAAKYGRTWRLSPAIRLPVFPPISVGMPWKRNSAGSVERQGRKNFSR